MSAWLGSLGGSRRSARGSSAFWPPRASWCGKYPGIRFLIVGDTDHGRPDAVHPSVAREYGVEQNCLFLGWRPNSELPLLYSLMDVLVLPSLWEGVPRAVMEASAMEVPAVVTDVPGNREAVAHGRNGLLVPVGDVTALASAVLTVLGDRAAAQRMAAEGRTIAEERFDEQQVFARVQTTYARLLAAKRLQRPGTLSTTLEGA